MSNDNLNKAISIIANSEIDKRKYDITLICEIISGDEKDKTHFIVEGDGMRFSAYAQSDNGSYNYKVKDYVNVLIPNGNYSERKIITGKYSSLEEAPETNKVLHPSQGFAAVRYVESFNLANGVYKPASTTRLTGRAHLITDKQPYIKLSTAITSSANTFQIYCDIEGKNISGTKVTARVIWNSTEMLGNVGQMNEGAFPQEVLLTTSELKSLNEITNISITVKNNSKPVSLSNTYFAIGYLEEDLTDGIYIYTLDDNYNYQGSEKKKIYAFVIENKKFIFDDTKLKWYLYTEGYIPRKSLTQNEYIKAFDLDKNNKVDLKDAEKIYNLSDSDWSKSFSEYMNDKGKTFIKSTLNDYLINTVIPNNKYNLIYQKDKDNLDNLWAPLVYDKNLGVNLHKENSTSSVKVEYWSENTVKFSATKQFSNKVANQTTEVNKSGTLSLITDATYYSIYDNYGRLINTDSRVVSAKRADEAPFNNSENYIVWEFDGNSQFNFPYSVIEQNGSYVWNPSKPDNIFIYDKDLNKIDLNKRWSLNPGSKAYLVEKIDNKESMCSVSFYFKNSFSVYDQNIIKAWTQPYEKPDTTLIVNQGSISFALGFADNSGTGYSFNIINKSNTHYFSNLEESKEYMVYLTSKEGEKVNLEQYKSNIKWTWFHDVNSLFEKTENGESCTVTYKTKGTNYNILVATLKNFTTTDGKTVDLTTFYPLGIASSSDIPMLQGTTYAIYDTFNNLVTCNDRNIEYQFGNGNYVTDITIYKYDSNNIEIENELFIRENNNGHYIGNFPKLKDNSPLTATFTAGNYTLYTPLILTTNTWFSKILNNWDGALKIDDEGNYILASMLGAGKKNQQNQFTGVLIGDIGKDVQSAKTGIYGFKDGKNTFKLDAETGEGNIAGWNIDTNKLYKVDQNRIRSTGMAATEEEDSPAFWAGYTGKGNTPYDNTAWTVNTNFYVTNGGYLFSKSGQIAGWNIQPNYMYSTNDNKITGIQSNGNVAFVAGGTDNTDWTKATFYVTHNGELYAKSGQIGGWNISSNKLTAGENKTGSVYFYLNTLLEGGSGFLGAKDADDNWCFTVDKEGKLHATGADISGKITATSGQIGDWTIGSYYLQSSDEKVGMSATMSNWAFWAGYASGDTAPFQVTHDGSVNCSNLTVTGGSINIGSNFNVTNTGVLKATGANISGSITATSFNINGYKLILNNSGLTFYYGTDEYKYTRISASGITFGDDVSNPIDWSTITTNKQTLDNNQPYVKVIKDAFFTLNTKVSLDYTLEQFTQIIVDCLYDYLNS